MLHLSFEMALLNSSAAFPIFSVAPFSENVEKRELKPDFYFFEHDYFMHLLFTVAKLDNWDGILMIFRYRYKTF